MSMKEKGLVKNIADSQGDMHIVHAIPLPARRAQKLLLRIVRAFGPSLGALMSSGGAGGISKLMDTDTSDLDLAAVFGGLADRLTDEVFDSIADTLVACVRVDGKDMSQPGNVDLVFMQEIMLYYKCLAAALEVNFGSFFGPGGIGNLVHRVQAPTPPTADE